MRLMGVNIFFWRISAAHFVIYAPEKLPFVKDRKGR
jgi:hypothetical protein